MSYIDLVKKEINLEMHKMDYKAQQELWFDYYGNFYIIGEEMWCNYNFAFFIPSGEFSKEVFEQIKVLIKRYIDEENAFVILGINSHDLKRKGYVMESFDIDSITYDDVINIHRKYVDTNEGVFSSNPFFREQGIKKARKEVEDYLLFMNTVR